MKKLILITGIGVSSVAFGQSSFTMKNGFTETIETEITGKSAEEIQNQIFTWIKKNYTNPDAVLKSELKNYIRIQGIQPALFCIAAGCQDGKYQITFNIEYGKYKMTVSDLQQRIGSWLPVDFNANKAFYFDNDGNLKKKFSQFSKIADYFNSINSHVRQ